MMGGVSKFDSAQLASAVRLVTHGGLSVEQAARAIGCSRSLLYTYVSKARRGETHPRLAQPIPAASPPSAPPVALAAKMPSVEDEGEDGAPLIDPSRIKETAPEDMIEKLLGLTFTKLGEAPIERVGPLLGHASKLVGDVRKMRELRVDPEAERRRLLPRVEAVRDRILSQVERYEEAAAKEGVCAHCGLPLVRT